jgi:hypothetical protein
MSTAFKNGSNCKDTNCTTVVQQWNSGKNLFVWPPSCNQFWTNDFLMFRIRGQDPSGRVSAPW